MRTVIVKATDRLQLTADNQSFADFIKDRLKKSSKFKKQLAKMQKSQFENASRSMPRKVITLFNALVETGKEKSLSLIMSDLGYDKQADRELVNKWKTVLCLLYAYTLR